MSKPVFFSWDGEQMIPTNRSMSKLCDELFVVGARYRLVEYEDRSINSHNHYFASLKTAHDNLSDELIERFPTVEHLRKYALIKCGYFDSRSLVVKSNAQAEAVAKFMRPDSEFSVVVAKEATVTIFTAKSQKKTAMGAKVFHESKQAVLDFVASLIGISTEQLTDNVRKAA